MRPDDSSPYQREHPIAIKDPSGMPSRSFTLTEAERSSLPTPEEVRFYREHGWYLTRKVLTDEEVDLLAMASERYYAGHRDRRLPVIPPKIAYWEPAHGDVARNNDYVFYEDATVERILSKPLIAAIAARLSETDQIRLFNTTLMYKPPNIEEGKTVVPWHFDRHYWQTCSSDNMLTAFIPLHDCDEAMGTIEMIDGSHKWVEVAKPEGETTVLHFALRDRQELEVLLEQNAALNGTVVRKLPMVIPRGHMSFHHCMTYHGSGANRSSRPRQALSLHLQDRGNEYRAFPLANGERLVYNNDVLCRRTPEGDPDYSDPTFCPVLWDGPI
jgi:ectoine hydroxylase-related dioxygenase (phytanoyl-CoA dioxygenase family)